MIPSHRNTGDFRVKGVIMHTVLGEILPGAKKKKKALDYRLKSYKSPFTICSAL